MLEDGRARLEVELEADRVDHDLRHTLGHLVDSAKIPGFRKGKVPPAVVLQRMGREEVFEETMREFLPAWVGEAIAESRLRPADRPSVDFEDDPGRGRAVHVHGRVPVAAHRHAAGGARDRGRAGGDRRSGRRGRRRARATARGVLAARHRRARCADRRLRRGRHARQRGRQARARGLDDRATSCSSATGARSRRSSARCAA